VWARIDTLGLAPLAQLFTADQDPFYGGTAQAATTFANTINTWQVQELSYTNTGTVPVPMTLRGSCYGSSGNMYMGWRRDLPKYVGLMQ
jgi:hypothetical protein